MVEHQIRLLLVVEVVLDRLVVLATPINVVVMEVLDSSMIFLEKVVTMPVEAEVEQEILLVVVDMVEMVAVVMVVLLMELMALQVSMAPAVAVAAVVTTLMVVMVVMVLLSSHTQPDKYLKT
tara:strand:- start:5 stop:370 length:366 start_codon:yes stop_codon:yes gene_type:complete